MEYFWRGTNSDEVVSCFCLRRLGAYRSKLKANKRIYNCFYTHIYTYWEPQRDALSELIRDQPILLLFGESESAAYQR